MLGVLSLWLCKPSPMPNGRGFKVSGEGGLSEGGVGVRGGSGIGRFDAMLGGAGMRPFYRRDRVSICRPGIEYTLSGFNRLSSCAVVGIWLTFIQGLWRSALGDAAETAECQAMESLYIQHSISFCYTLQDLTRASPRHATPLTLPPPIDLTCDSRSIYNDT